MVVGAGAVGCCIALDLARSGAEVALVERAGWGAGCSRGNAGIICPSHAGPFATLGDTARALRWAARRSSPFGISPSPTLLPWLVRLLRASARPREVQRVTRTLLELSRESLGMHERYAADGMETGFARRGLLDVYRSRRAFAGARKALRPVLGSEPLSASETHHVEPLLSVDLAGAVLHPNEAHCDPLDFVTAVGRTAVAAGVTLCDDTAVTAIRPREQGVRLLTSRGTVDAGVVVLASGASTPVLAPGLPIASGVGYSVTITHQPPPRRPLLLQEARTAVTPAPTGMRLAGAMWLDRPQRAPVVDQRRLGGIIAATAVALPSTANAARGAGWAGARPCTPDGLPAIGWMDRQHRVVVAAGHAMLGLTLAPVTGALVRGLLDGTPDTRLAVLDPNRFAR